MGEHNALFRGECPHPSPCWCHACRSAYARVYQRLQWVALVCTECGERSVGSPGTKKCRSCRPKRWVPIEAPCTQCSEPFLKATAKAMFCSRKCIDRAKHERLYGPRLRVTKQCRWCLRDYDGKPTTICCSDQCRSALDRHMATWHAPDRCFLPLCLSCGGTTGHGPQVRFCDGCLVEQRGARAVAERAGDKINLLDLYKRDGGICHICKKKCRLNVPSSHPKYATKDHLVPVSRDGEHLWVNVALACRGCNTKRGVGGEVQLRLVG